MKTRDRKTPHQLLAEALSEAKAQSREGVIKSAELSRAHKDRLVAAGCLTEILRGWYLLTKPEAAGSSTAWFGGYWAFVKYYLEDRFEQDYCLSAESSVNIHAGESAISRQLTVITRKPSNQCVDLLHETSILLYQDEKNFPQLVEKARGVNVMPLAGAICRLSPSYFQTSPLNAELALKILNSVSELSRILLINQSIAAAGRIAGAYEALGEGKKSKQIIDDMTAVGYSVEPSNPFEKPPVLVEQTRLKSPYAGRIIAMWKRMRLDVIENYPESDGVSDKTTSDSIRIIKELYKQDAYHSLSIEGYHVTEDLIQKIQSGKWDPAQDENDRKQRDALAAKGYLKAFSAVLNSIKRALNGENPAEVIEENLQEWYRELFAPLVNAGILQTSELAGYRNHPVYISESRHVPPPSSAILDSMDALFDLLKKEENAAVRAILGHFVFVYIHPYMDGNGRIGRFFMNLMLVSGGFNWTVIRTTERTRYMRALESASVQGDIVPFTKFVASEMKHWKKEISKHFSN